MSWFKKLFGGAPADPVPTETRTNADGSTTTTTSFTLSGDTVRPVQNDVVEALDAALGTHGEMLHGIDPTRMMSFRHGGPPVWSVALVRVESPTPHWLWVTYGFSGRLTPIDYREAYAHEYSIAIPCTDGQPPVWPAALLRHLCRYVLNTRAELRVGDNMPCGGPISRVAFASEHHASMPDSALNTLLVATDPLIPVVQTPQGPVEIRRFVGLHSQELQLLQQWSGTSFAQEMGRTLPTLACDLDREPLPKNPDFMARVQAAIAEEGSSCGFLFVKGGWKRTPTSIMLGFPGGEDAGHILSVLKARLPFGRPLILQGPPDLSPIRFEPYDTFAMGFEGDIFVIRGNLDDPKMQPILGAIQPGGPGRWIELDT